MLLYAEVIIGAFVLCIMLNIGLRKISKFSGVLLSKGISAIGGVSIWTGFCVASCWGLDELEVISSGPLVIIATSFVMLVFGIFDDYKNFSVTAKFLTQIFSVSLLMFFGISTKVVYIGPYFNALITLIWVIGIANAFNHLDISDGVAGVIGVLISSSFLIISILNHDKSSLIFSLALCGSLLGFLVLNLPPAKIYMGNSGSHFLGFLFAAIAIAISYAPMERKIALISPIFILGLPILDTAYLIFVRLSKRKVPFQKSNDHIILRLQMLGYSKNKILVIMGIWGLFFAISGIAVSQFSSLWGLIAVGCVSIISFQIIKIINRVVVND